MKRKATAEWKGGLKDGKGLLATETGILSNTPYSFTTRFEDGKGTNPEELIAAALAGCFSMAFAGALEKENFNVEQLKSEASVSLEKTDGGFSIPTIHLEVTGRVPNVDKETFEEIAQKTKSSCPVSKLLNAKITLDANLENK